MAEKRMFTRKITDSDPFKEMPLSAQALYFHLGMNADDEGFLNNAKSIQRSILASEDDMKLLIVKGFVILFESGIVVIKHWKMHNTIQPSRLKETQYTEEKNLLAVKDNQSYTLNLKNADKMLTNCQQNDNKCCQNDAEIRLDEIRLEEIRLDECLEEKNTPTLYGEYKNVILSDQELDKLKAEYPDYLEKIEKISSYMASTGKDYISHYATIKRWAKEDKAKQQQNKPKNGFHNFQQRDYNYDELETELLKRNKRKE